MNYLAEPGDQQVLAEGVEIIREIMKSAAFGGNVKAELHPGPQYNAANMKAEVLNRATTVYHGVGTCRMGTDERAVVGPDLKVAASRACASPTPRSCRRSSAATPTHRRS